MKLLFIVHDGALYGSQQSLLLLVQGLLALPNPPTITVSLAKDGPLRQRLTVQGVQVQCHQRLGWFKHSRRSVWQRWTGSLSLLLASPFRIARLAQTVKQADVVHTNSLVSLEGALTAWVCRKPHVWHIREWLTPDNPGLFPVLPTVMTRWLVNRLSRKVIGISSAVIAGVGAQANKAVLVPNAVLPVEAAPVRTAVFRVGFVGRFSAGKRVTDLLAAFAELHQKHPHSELWLMGRAENPTDQAVFDQALNQYGQGVTVKGFCHDMASLYPQLTVLALPASNEAFGRVLAEAMAYGVPCIGANAGGIPDVLGKTGWLHPATDQSAMTNRLLEAYQAWLAADLWLQRQLACQKRVAEKFNLDAQLQRLNVVWQTAL